MMPRSLAGLTALQHLKVTGQVPAACGQLRSLTELSVSYASQSCLPQSIGEISCLVKLSIEWGKLARFPSTLGYFRNLQELKVERNVQLELCADVLSGLSSLQTLELIIIKQLTLPADVQLSHLTRLQVSYTEVTLHPQCFSSMPALKVLDLEALSLSQLPESIQLLSSLSSLRLDSMDDLSSLPDSLGQLPSLKDVLLAKLRLCSLPASIGSLSSLTCLHVRYCVPLTSLPPTIGRLQSLRKLIVRQCPNLKVPKALLQALPPSCATICV